MGSLVNDRLKLKSPALETPAQASNGSSRFMRGALFLTKAAVQLVNLVGAYGLCLLRRLPD